MKGPVILQVPKGGIDKLRREVQEAFKLQFQLKAAMARADANSFVQQFKKHIKKNDLGLKRLVDLTIQAKRDKGYSKPSVPLYGAGDEKKNSYINMFKIIRKKNSYEAVPRTAKHHESDLPLKALFQVHEYGSVITVGNKKIRIPKRPAGRRTYILFKKSSDHARHIRVASDAIARFRLNRKLSILTNAIAKLNKEVDKSNEAGN